MSGRDITDSDKELETENDWHADRHALLQL